ncbi:MAG: hypothetical protein HOY78_22260 [Saccharothrix sp.]|nr:hypothetical protein [Saccharothrix sp.]
MGTWRDLRRGIGHNRRTDDNAGTDARAAGAHRVERTREQPRHVCEGRQLTKLTSS